MKPGRSRAPTLRPQICSAAVEKPSRKKAGDHDDVVQHRVRRQRHVVMAGALRGEEQQHQHQQAGAHHDVAVHRHRLDHAAGGRARSAAARASRGRAGGARRRGRRRCRSSSASRFATARRRQCRNPNAAPAAAVRPPLARAIRICRPSPISVRATPTSQPSTEKLAMANGRGEDADGEIEPGRRAHRGAGAHQREGEVRHRDMDGDQHQADGEGDQHGADQRARAPRSDRCGRAPARSAPPCPCAASRTPRTGNRTAARRPPPRRAARRRRAGLWRRWRRGRAAVSSSAPASPAARWRGSAGG